MRRLIVFFVYVVIAALSYAQAPLLIDGGAYYKFGDIFIKQNSGKQQKSDFSLRLFCEMRSGVQKGDDCIIEPDPTIKEFDDYIGFDMQIPIEKTFMSFAIYKGSNDKSAPIYYYEVLESSLRWTSGHILVLNNYFTLNGYLNESYIGDALIRSLYVKDIEAYSLMPGQYTFAVTIIREGSEEPETLYKTFNLSYRYENDVLGMFSNVGIKRRDAKDSMIEAVPGTNTYKTKAYRLELIDALGRILKSVEGPEKPLTIEEAGVYFLRAREKNGRVAGSKGVVKTR
jgi:hypothetical protein